MAFGYVPIPHNGSLEVEPTSSSPVHQLYSLAGGYVADLRSNFGELDVW